jgi:hypothetical protein
MSVLYLHQSNYSSWFCFKIAFTFPANAFSKLSPFFVTPLLPNYVPVISESGLSGVSLTPVLLFFNTFAAHLTCYGIQKNYPSTCFCFL